MQFISQNPPDRLLPVTFMHMAGKSIRPAGGDTIFPHGVLII